MNTSDTEDKNAYVQELQQKGHEHIEIIKSPSDIKVII